MYPLHLFKRARLVFRAGAVVAVLGFVAVIGGLVGLLVPILQDASLEADAIRTTLLIAALPGLWIAYRLRTLGFSQLWANHLTVQEDSPHRLLLAALRHHIRCGRRLATQPALPPDVSTAMRHTAATLTAAADHHPLRDDLFRGLQQARDELFAPAYHHLDGLCAAITSARVAALVHQLKHPPLKLLASLKHQLQPLILVVAITKIYLPRPSLFELLRSIADTSAVLADCSRALQDSLVRFTLTIPPELGRVASAAWVTHLAAQVAAQRCRTLHDWTLEWTLARQEEALCFSLQATRKSLAHPLEKNAPASLKALDDLLMSMNTGGCGKSR